MTSRSWYFWEFAEEHRVCLFLSPLAYLFPVQFQVLSCRHRLTCYFIRCALGTQGSSPSGWWVYCISLEIALRVEELCVKIICSGELYCKCGFLTDYCFCFIDLQSVRPFQHLRVRIENSKVFLPGYLYHCKNITQKPCEVFEDNPRIPIVCEERKAPGFFSSATSGSVH